MADLTGHHYGEPTCIWRDRRDGTATTHQIGPGDRVHLCTAQAIWPVTDTHDDDTVTIGARDGWTQPMRVHRAHLDPAVGHTPELDRQTTIYDHMEDT